MNLTAVILTFRDNAFIAATLLALALFFLAALLLHRRRRGLAMSLAAALLGFALASVGIYYYYGIKVASVELVTYRMPSNFE